MDGSLRIQLIIYTRISADETSNPGPYRIRSSNTRSFVYQTVYTLIYFASVALIL